MDLRLRKVRNKELYWVLHNGRKVTAQPVTRDAARKVWNDIRRSSHILGGLSTGASIGIGVGAAAALGAAGYAVYALGTNSSTFYDRTIGALFKQRALVSKTLEATTNPRAREELKAIQHDLDKSLRAVEIAQADSSTLDADATTAPETPDLAEEEAARARAAARAALYEEAAVAGANADAIIAQTRALRRLDSTQRASRAPSAAPTSRSSSPGRFVEPRERAPQIVRVPEPAFVETDPYYAGLLANAKRIGSFDFVASILRRVPETWDAGSNIAYDFGIIGGAKIPKALDPSNVFVVNVQRNARGDQTIDGIWIGNLTLISLKTIQAFIRALDAAPSYGSSLSNDRQKSAALALYNEAKLYALKNFSSSLHGGAARSTKTKTRC